MTFSRAQMIDAYLAGSRERKKYAKVPDYDAAFRYVDSLQNASPGLSDALRSDALPGYRPTLNPEIERLDITLREHILKSQERELVLAKVVSSQTVKMLQFQAAIQNLDSSMLALCGALGAIPGHKTLPSMQDITWSEDHAERINAVFPELTPEE